MGQTWWESAVIYQVYPRSFADSDGDGVGDIDGIRSRLPYLAELGVDGIWLSPFYPSPLADGGYDVSDYTGVDPLLGTLDGFDALVSDAASHGIRVLTDLVPNHCSSRHPLFRAALAASAGSTERARFIFRDGRDGGPPNNWRSLFGGPAWTQVPDGQWYLHLFDSGQPDWNWRDPDVPALFERVIRFWLDRGVAGLRIDVAHGLFKDPALPDLPDATRAGRPAAYFHRPELQDLYRTWRTILDSYPADAWPGQRTAVGEVWYDGGPRALVPYLAPGGLPQVFNFELIGARWDLASMRGAITGTQALAGGARAPWVIGNHDVVRPVTRYGSPARARAAALLSLALPGSAYIYQGEELGLPEVLSIPDAARADPAFRRSGGKVAGRDGCRVPLPWERGGASFGFSRTSSGSTPAPPWLPQPQDWGAFSVDAEREDPGSFLRLYTAALRLRRSHPALGTGGASAGAGGASAGAGDASAGAGDASLTWRDAGPGVLCFKREPGFVFAANFGTRDAALPPGEILLASQPLRDRTLPPDTAAWLST